MSMSTRYTMIVVFINFYLISCTRIIENDFFTKEARNLVKKINRLSLSLDNEPLLNNLLERFKKYIFEHDIERVNAKKEKYKYISKAKSNFTEEDDGTYDLYSHFTVEFNHGYQVSFETRFDDYTEQDYDEICYKLSLMTDNNVYLGVWSGDAEFSFYFEDFDLANSVAILFNQISIWDWNTMTEIDNKFYKEYY